MEEYNLKITKWNNRVVLKKYEVPIRTGKKKPVKVPRKKFAEMNEQEQQESLERKRKYQQSRIKYLRQIAGENNFNLFITLTHADDVQDPIESRRFFRLWIKRLRYKYPDIDIKHMAVPEKTKKGRTHWHVLLAGIDFLPHEELQELWGHGYVFIKQIKNSGAIDYVFKYLSKELENAREPWQKIYCSRNLQKPEVTKTMTADKVEDIIFDNLEQVIDDGQYIVTQETGIPINRCNVVTIDRHKSR